MTVSTNMRFYIHKSVYDRIFTYYGKSEEMRPPDELLWEAFRCRIHKVDKTFYIPVELENELISSIHAGLFESATIKHATETDETTIRKGLKLSHEEATILCASMATVEKVVFLIVDIDELPRIRKIVMDNNYRFKVTDIDSALTLIKKMRELSEQFASQREDGHIEYTGE